MVTNSDNDRVFKALADGARRDILTALLAQPQPVHVIAERFDISRPAISKHLCVLKSAGLVSARRVGGENVYHIHEGALAEVIDWLRPFWFGKLHMLKALAERNT